MQSYSSKYLLLLLVFSILVLLISVVGISFALSYYDKEVNDINYVKNGVVSLKINDDKRILLSEDGCVPDEIGVSDNRYRTDFRIFANVDSVYDLGIDKVVENTNYYNYVKIAVIDEHNRVLVGNKDSFGNIKSGVYLKSLKNKQGKYKLISNYNLLSSYINAGETSQKYTLITYISNVFTNKTIEKNQKSENVEIKLTIIASQK